MEKRITTLSTEPHTVSLSDRSCSLFIDPRTGAILVDEGDGDGRMNGAVFSVAHGPWFAVRPHEGADSQLLLDYRGTEFPVGVTPDVSGLRAWAASANALLARIGGRVPPSAAPSSNSHASAPNALSPGPKVA